MLASMLPEMHHGSRPSVQACLVGWWLPWSDGADQQRNSHLSPSQLRGFTLAHGCSADMGALRQNGILKGI